MNWQADKRWSDRFLPEIKAILGGVLIGEAAPEDDAERNTDLMVLKMDGVRIGCRIRKHEYIRAYGEEFTIRAVRPSGAKTELAKIVEGWGDYFFYGFSSADCCTLARWFVGDFKVFRLWFSITRHQHKHQPGLGQRNTDGSSEFYAYRLADLPDNFVVKRSWQPQERLAL